MKNIIKRFLTTPFVCLILIISMLALPMSANAEAGTLGTETPHLSCNFYDSTGKAVDGNRLVANNTYTVDVVLSGMKAVSVVELTANYTTESFSSIYIKSTYADKNKAMKKGGQKAQDGEVSVFQIAESDDPSVVDSHVIDPNGTVMMTLSVTVKSSCDFADVFTFSKDPQRCFIEASYKDGVDDCYVLDTTVATEYKTYKMTADESPYFVVTEFNVNGVLSVASDLTGKASTAPAAGVTATLKNGDAVVATTTTGKDGSYKFADVTAGEYKIVFSGSSTIDREITITVSAEKAEYNQIRLDNVGICVVDFNKDTKINATDVALFSKAKLDLNGDGVFDEADYTIFRTFLYKTVNYTQLIL